MPSAAIALCTGLVSRRSLRARRIIPAAAR